MKLHPSRPKKTRQSLTGLVLGLVETKKSSDKLILRTLLFVFIASLLSAGIILNNNFSESTPVEGGVLSEGIVGIPRFVNPALAVTRADQDMSALIYSGLMKINPEGNLVPDVAESITVSEDRKTYNIIVRNNIRFHDGTPLTARDVSFTIGLMQNADLKSPLRGNWVGVTVEEIGEYELNIIISEPYTPFIENFTFGILPKHIWGALAIEQVPFSKFNTEPIGSGPFSIKDITKDTAGLINKYSLKKFTENAAVKLDGVNIHFYQNENDLLLALNNKEISSATQLPADEALKFKNNPSYQIIEEPMPRVFAIFFNQNRTPILRDTAVRLALAAAIDRSILIDSALSGFGVPIKYPVPQNHPAVESISQTASAASSTPLQTAENILTKAGWTKSNTGSWEKRIDGEVKSLSITLKTANTLAFEQTTEVVARAWRELGVDVQVEQFEQSDLLQNVIRPRDFESLLFGLDMNRSVDLYPFWHSSQREDPGLNISQYANIEVDKLLELARSASSTDIQNTAITDAINILNREAPAVFLYSPNMVYILDSNVKTVPMHRISRPQDRFMNVTQWHMNTENLWTIFK